MIKRKESSISLSKTSIRKERQQEKKKGTKELQSNQKAVTNWQ